MIRMLCLVLVVFALLYAPGLDAQGVRGILLEHGTADPISGAVVLLLDGSGQRSDGTLTDEAGRFQLRAPSPGRYLMRAERIGYRSVSSPLLDLAAGQLLDYRMEAPAEAVELTGIVVTSERRCAVRPEIGTKTAEVWEEARKALSAAALAQDRGVLRYTAVTYQRDLDPDDLRVRHERRQSRSASGTHPFVSMPADQLREGGFVRHTSEGMVYYAPDADVLLSDEFLGTHCFRLTEDEGAGLIGLAFEPVPGRRLPEIAGTLWLDEKTAELRHLEFRYTNLDFDVPAERLGGRTEFERTPSGAWIVRRWWIRMPVVGVRRSSWGGRLQEEQVLTSVREEGGEVVRFSSAYGELVAEPAQAHLSGVVYDSIRAAPLAGAVVFLSGTQHSATTDGQGRFQMDALPEGRYSVAFDHPRLDSLGVAALPSREVVLERGEGAEVQLGVPPMARILAAACPEAESEGGAQEQGRMPGDEIGVLVGTVRDVVTGLPIPGATVEAWWSRYKIDEDRGRAQVTVNETRSGFETRTDEQGRYRLCGVPALIPVSVQARLLGRAGAKADVRLLADEALLRDLELGRLPAGRLLGHVVDIESGQPVVGATVRLGASELQQVTDRQGRFAFAEVPAGMYPIAISHLAYGSHADSVHVDAGQATEIEARLPRGVIALEGVVVSVRSTRAEASVARATPLRLFTREDVDRLSPGARHIGDLLRNVPGVMVREGGNADSGLCVEAGQRIRSARTVRGCEMVQVYVDDVRVIDAGAHLRNLPLADIESIEFLKPAEAGVRYGTAAGTGVLVIYTRGNGPFARPQEG